MAETIIHRHQIVYGPVQIMNRVIWILNGILETLLALRFLLRLFGANPGAGFTNFIYTVTKPLVAPFTNVFGAVSQSTIGQGIWDWAPLLAIIVYSLIAWGLVELLSMDGDVHVDDIETKS